MAPSGPNFQRRYIQPDSPSTTNLLSTRSPLSVRAALAQPPGSPRSVSSDASVVGFDTNIYVIYS